MSMVLVPIQRMRDRLVVEGQDSDAVLSLASLYYGELVLKLITAAMVAAVREDRERHRYRHCHRLVRADGIGEWHSVLREVLLGPSSQYLDPVARQDARELTEKQPPGRPVHEATRVLGQCLSRLQIDAPATAGHLSFMHWADAFVLLRNKTRGHGAQRSSVLAAVCAPLRDSIDRIADSLSLFQRPWAYLKRNLSGKFRVTALAGDVACFSDLKRRTDVSLTDGVYVMFEAMRRLELLHSDPEASDFLFPNGGFTDHRYEILSHITGDTQHAESRPYLLPADRLPPSETEGLGSLDIKGHCFCNLPPEPSGYVARERLESQLRDELALRDRHPIVTLTGPGGIGKTSLALRVLHRMAMEDPPPYGVLIWFSARDIDLLPHGPKTVRPSGVSLRDFADMYVTLLEPPERHEKGFKSVDYLAKDMARPSFAPTLFVFDNFETVTAPAELFAWIDSMVRPPNKVLITTRMRGDFRADFPVQVTGMDEPECVQLISNVSEALDIVPHITESYRQEIIEESDGHPYVIKVLLGEVAKAGHRRKIERIVADRDEILLALFERTYSALTPSAQRVFLVLSNWRSMVPEIAIEAVMLRPANERIDVAAALDELVQSSLVDEVASDDGDTFLNVPLAAALFGQRKLVASPWKAAVDADTQFLRAFGATQRTDVRHGLSPRVGRFFRNVAAAIANREHALEDVVPTLEYVCRRYPVGWLLLADLYAEVDSRGLADRIKGCLQHYLELNADQQEASHVWRRLADVCRDTGDLIGELHALAGMCKVPAVPTLVVSSAANRVNQRMSQLAHDERRKLEKEEKNILFGGIVDVLEARLEQLDAKGCSRLAWLHMHLGNESRAREIAERGLHCDANDFHCQKLLVRLAEGRHSTY